MRATDHLTASEARWLAIAGQRLDAPRTSSAVTVRRLRDVIAGIGTVQLDAISVLQRTQFLVLFSRVGAYDVNHLHQMTGPGGELLEYWGHAASLLPVEVQPLFRWRMAEHARAEGGGAYSVAARAWREQQAGYIAAVLDEVRDRGPLVASELSDPQRRQGQWWERRSAGRVALEWLFGTGVLAAWRRPTFERVYDLPSRVIPAAVLARPTPERDDAHRALLLLAAESLGVATAGDLADYYRLKPGQSKARLAELVESGDLVRVAVEGWLDAAYCRAAVHPRPPTRSGATLLSPFDSLIWARARTGRLFAFDYRTEVYVSEPNRTYGYYVLPLLVGDQLVGRFDVKSDRKGSALRVLGAYLEPGADRRSVAAAAATELDAMRSWLGLDTVAVGDRGNLAIALRRAVRAAETRPRRTAERG